jgi:tetratricopeptide (TPR) repeat protein
MRRSSTVAVTLRSVLAPLAPIWAPLVIWNGYGLVRGRPSVIGLVALAGFVLWLGYRVLPMFLYPSANRDREWHRWRPLRAKVRLLRLVVAARTPAAARPALDREWDGMAAAALAGLGRLPEALSLLARHDGGDDLSRALHQGRLASILAIVEDVEGAMRAAEAATLLAPDSPMHWIDLALRRLVHRQDAAGARQALEHARRHPVSELAWAWMQVADALIESEAGEPAQALARLGQADVELVRAAPPESAIDGLRALLAAHRCLAYAALGNEALARREWRLARPFLEATGQGELNARCRAALKVAG